MVLSDTAIRRPVTVILFTLGVLAFGYMSLQGMGVDLFPEVDFPIVTVTATLPGADPEIMDSDVADLIEEQINTISGVKTITTTSRDSFCVIVVEFVLSKDVDVAAQEVRDKINIAQADLPDDLEPPIVDKVDIAASPIVWLAVTSAGDYSRMARYTDDILKERIQSIPGVGAVEMTGFRDREIRIWLDPSALESYGLTPSDVARAIKTKHIELPGGRIEQPERELVVKVEGEYKSVDELKNLVIFERGGTVVRLREVAQVIDGTEDYRSVARFNGIPSIGLGVRKQSGTNSVAVANAVKAEVAKLTKDVPAGINVQIASDSAPFIEGSMRDVIFDLFLGGLLTAGVMILFLRNFRLTFISITSIPVSIIGCFVVMYFLGFTINNMTMLAMSLAIGIVIDDAIVVLENIFRHVEEKGEDAMTASHTATSEVGLAVLAASSAIMAVFLPVAFMKGIIGRFFFQFGLSVALAVFISLIVSFSLTPMLCSRLLRHDPNHGPIFRALEWMLRSTEAFYARTLDLALRLRWVTLLAGLVFFICGLALIPFIRKEFVTEPDESQFMVRFEFPTGTSIQKADAGMREIEKIVYAQKEVKSAFASVGGNSGVNTGSVFVNMLPRDERAFTQEEVMTRLRTILVKEMPEANTAVEPPSLIGGGQRNAKIQFVIQGPTVQGLQKVSEGMMADMAKIKGFVDVDSDLRLNKPEVKVDINRDLADSLGVDVYTIAENYNILFGGLDVAKYKEGGKQYDIRLRALPNSRGQSDDLYQIALRSTTGALVRSPNLLNVREGIGPNSVNRYNRRRAVTLYANTENMGLEEALTTMEGFAKKHIPNEPGWSTALTGGSDVFRESFGYLLIALLTSIVLIYIVLGSQFESFIHPFTILLSVPLAVVGGIGFLMILGLPLDIFAFIGFIMIVGIVAKNAILLVDFTNQARARGVPREEALRLAGPLRFRPILMTSLTVMASMVPVMMALGEGGEQRAPMGASVFGGVLTSTLLTLLVIPCAYSVMDDLSLFTRRLFSRHAQHEAHTQEAAEKEPMATATGGPATEAE
jgi:HAE1 family hydrophobic/amphiphilic exporter-1